MELNENLKLGEPLNLEEDEKYEFKEFCLDKYTSCSTFSEKETINIIKNGIFSPKFNKLIKTNLFYYLQKYIPKYYCSFCNSNLKSKLIIGVNDLGEITGIPLFNLSENEIKSYIENQVFQKINGQDININDFNIKVINLEKDKSMIHNISKDLLEDYITNKNKRQLIFDEYNKKYKKWHNELQIKSGKLIRILNNPQEKQEFINYLNKNKASNNIIQYIKNNTNFIIPRGETMKIRKENKNDYIYWLTQFKDKQQKDMVDIKPIKPYYKMCIDPYIILDKLTDLRYNFIDNKKINYYMIIIEINGLSKTSPLFYFKKDKLIFRKRIGNICL